MCELLIQLHGKQEVCGRPLQPATSHPGVRHAIEGRIPLDGVEALGVVAQLVESASASRRVEHAIPGPAPARVIPAGGADADGHQGQRMTRYEGYARYAGTAWRRSVRHNDRVRC